MPPEPKKPIENLLEASAHARRAEFGADPAMPNPMRARLHDEIGRIGREEADKAERPRGFSIWWPRIAIAAVATLILIAGPVMWRQHKSRSGGETLELAMGAPAAPSGPAPFGMANQEPAKPSEAEVARNEPAMTRSLAEAPPVAAPFAGGADAGTISGEAKHAESADAAGESLSVASSAKKAKESSDTFNKFADASMTPPPAQVPAWNFKEDQNLTKGAVTTAASGAAAGSDLKMEAPGEAKIQEAASAPLAPAAPASGDSFAAAPSGGAQNLERAKAASENSNALRKFAQVAITPAEQTQAGKLLNKEQRLADGSVVSKNPSAALASGQKMSAANSQQFSQNSMNQGARFNSKLKQAISILNTFQIEQKGTQIRVVDADGSTYTGKIEPLAPNDSRNIARQSQNYAGRDKDAEANGADFYFRASGYNGSLKKRIVFEGNYIVTEPAQEKRRATDAVNEQVPARVVGTARISGESPVQVDAVSVAQ